MKTYLALGLCAVLASCSTEKAVTKVTFDNTAKTPVYKDKGNSTVEQDDAFVVEGGTISVEAINYNPLNTSFTVQQDAGVLFFTSAASGQPTTLLNYVGQVNTITPKAVAGVIARGAGNECTQTQKVNDKEQELSYLLNKISNFYAAVNSFNRGFEVYKTLPELNKDAFYHDLDIWIDGIKNNYNSPTAPTATDGGTGYVFTNRAEGNRILAESNNYKVLLQQKNAELTTELGILAGMAACANPLPNTSIAQTQANATVLLNEINTKLSAMADVTAGYIMQANSISFTDSQGSFIAADTDELVLKMSVKDAANNVKVYHLAKLPVKKAIKIDYSAGVFFTGLYDETYTKTVATTDIPDADPPATQDNYTLHKNDGGGLSYGAIGFVNFHSQWGKFFNVGASLGAGLRFNDETKLVLAPMASFFFGKYQRLILHAGVAFSQVDHIYSKYGSESFTDAEYVPETKSIVKSSFIFSLSWNLTR